MRNRPDDISTLIDRAQSYIGMRSRERKINDFGARSGLNGQAWNGAFLETVYSESFMSPGVSLVNTTAALSYFVRENRLYRKPKRGDIVFFNYSTDAVFGQPNIGLVTEVRDNRSFRAVAGQVNPGTPRGHEDEDGVYEKTYYITEVVGFARPALRPRHTTVTPAEKLPALRASQFVNGKTTKATVLLQTALHDVTGATDFKRGVFDSYTRTAVALFQREHGMPARRDGQVDEETLDRLAKATDYRYFRARRLGEGD